VAYLRPSERWSVGKNLAQRLDVCVRFYHYNPPDLYNSWGSGGI